MPYDREFEKAAMLASVGKNDEAMGALAGMLARDPHDPDALVLKGMLLLSSGRPAEAYTAAGQACAANPDHPFAYLVRAAALLAQERPDLAEADVRRLLTLAPDLSDGWALRALTTGLSVAQQGLPIRTQRDEVVGDAEQFQRLGGLDDPGMTAMTAMGLAAVKETGRAERICAEALRRHPQDAQLTATLALVRSGRPVDVQAFPLFERAIRTDSGTTQVATLGMEITWLRRISRVQGTVVWVIAFCTVAVTAEFTHGWSAWFRTAVGGALVLAALLIVVTGMRTSDAVHGHLRERPGVRSSRVFTVLSLPAVAAGAVLPRSPAVPALGVAAVLVLVSVHLTHQTLSAFVRRTQAEVQPILRAWVMVLISTGMAASMLAVPILVSLLADRWDELRFLAAGMLVGASAAGTVSAYPMWRWRVIEVMRVRTGRRGPVYTALLVLLALAAAWAPRWWGVALIGLMVPAWFLWTGALRWMLYCSDPRFNQRYSRMSL
ncbi:tetratricopeptide repeat protein [Streptomyces sp. NPDC004069]